VVIWSNIIYSLFKGKNREKMELLIAVSFFCPFWGVIMISSNTVITFFFFNFFKITKKKDPIFWVLSLDSQNDSFLFYPKSIFWCGLFFSPKVMPEKVHFRNFMTFFFKLLFYFLQILSQFARYFGYLPDHFM